MCAFVVCVNNNYWTKTVSLSAEVLSLQLHFQNNLFWAEEKEKSTTIYLEQNLALKL